MSQAELVYAETLNLLGSDILGPEIQELLDREHAEADPDFKEVLSIRHLLAMD